MSRAESGQIAVMTIGFFVVIGLLVALVVNASSAFLQYQELTHLADGAALAAADGLDRDAFYRDGVDERLQIDAQEARRLVVEYVAATGEHPSSLSVEVLDDSIVVRMTEVIDLAIAPPGWPSESTIEAEATSQLRLVG